MKRLGTVTYRPDGIAVLEREGAEDVVVETTPTELPAVLLETYGPGAQLEGFASPRGTMRVDVVLPPAVTAAVAIPRPARAPDPQRELTAAIEWRRRQARAELPTIRPGSAS